MLNKVDPTLHVAVLSALEGAINRALSLAPHGGEELAPFEGEVFALHCTVPNFELYLHPGRNQVRLSGIHEGQVTTLIRGEASAFAELASSGDPAATLINGALELEGDSAPLIALQKALSNLDVDWEAPLVDTLGDVAGHQLAEVLRISFSWGSKAATSLTRQLEEFIHEEARLSPPRLELEDFYADLRDLGQHVERLQLRAQRLRKKINALKA